MRIGRSNGRLYGRFRQVLSGVARGFHVEALCGSGTDELVRKALAACGKNGTRSCPLQPSLVAWFVILMALLRNDSMLVVFARVVESLRGRIGGLPRRVVTDGALCHARRRLGAEVMRRLLCATGTRTAAPPAFHGFRVCAIDGVRLDMPDTPSNARLFERLGAPGKRGAFPQSLVVVLLDVAQHLVLDAKICSSRGSEPGAARRLCRSLGPKDLVVLDRGFLGLPLLRAVCDAKAHFLVRASSRATLAPLGGRKARRTGDYDARLQCRVPLEAGETRATRVGRPGKTKVVEMQVRVVEYQVPGRRPDRLVTNLPREIPAHEIVALYHKRWEIEIAFDEIKTVQASPAQGTLRTDLRSKSPRGVVQEIYALLTAYNLVRETMVRAAQTAEIDPLTIGFSGALQVVRSASFRMAAARTEELPAMYRQLLDDIVACRLDRPRRRRRYPRVVKRAYSKFPVKRSLHRALPPLIPSAVAAHRPARAACSAVA